MGSEDAEVQDEEVLRRADAQLEEIAGSLRRLRGAPTSYRPPPGQPSLAAAEPEAEVPQLSVECRSKAAAFVKNVQGLARPSGFDTVANLRP